MNLITKLRNAPHSHYGACYKRGGNWGWKKGVDRMTSKSTGLFLFCEQCDKIVTIEERWEALDKWKIKSIREIASIAVGFMTEKKQLEELKRIIDTEFIEFPSK